MWSDLWLPSPCYQGLPQVTFFHLGPQTPHIKLLQGLSLIGLLSCRTKMGFINCCNSTSIPPVNEIVSSPCSSFYVWFFWSIHHPSLTWGRGQLPLHSSPSRRRKKNQIFALLILWLQIPGICLFRQNGVLEWVWKDNFETTFQEALERWSGSFLADLVPLTSYWP